MKTNSKRNDSITASLKNTIKRPIVCLKNWFADCRSAHYIKKWNHTHVSGECVRVGFIVQMPEIWDKEEPVFLGMSQNSRFETTLIVVPPYDFAYQKLTTDYTDNYFLRKYGDKAVCAYKDGKWIELDDRFDYVFYQRPYDVYLPMCLRSSTVVKHARCCYIPYAFTLSTVFSEIGMNKAFFRNMYYSFLESDVLVSILQSKFKRAKEYYHIVNLGFPVLEAFFGISASGQYDNVIYTPRWSFDGQLGGSTFLINQDLIFKIKRAYPKGKVIFRPHPLMFGKLIKQGFMSERQIKEYQEKMRQEGIVYDAGDLIYDTFSEGDILVTDFSSIIVQFFITGKPIIYCERGIEPNTIFKKMMAGLYIVHNEAEILSYIDELKKGNDTLYEVRRRIIAEEFQCYRNSTEKIIEKICQDAKG